MASPQFKVYSPDGEEYIGCCKLADDAAILAAYQGKGATVRFGHYKSKTCWTVPDDSINFNWEQVAGLIWQEVKKQHKEILRGH